MGRARRARKIAARAAYGGGLGAVGLAGVGLSTWAVLKGEAAVARRIVGTPFDDAPLDSGLYGAAPGELIDVLVLGDSTAKGMGADSAHETVGAIIATATAAIQGRPVRLTNLAAVGAISTDLGEQVERGLTTIPHPAVAVIMIGANDVTKSVPRSTSVRHLAAAVSQLREADCDVIVGTCPDLGVVQPVPQPLRRLVRRWSRDLAAAQTVAVVEHGGRTVSLTDLLGSEFERTPHVMFSKDRFHPSAAGYARVASALLPSVLDALQSRSRGPADDDPTELLGRDESVRPVSVAAMRAVRHPGTEVSAASVGGVERGTRGRWARLLRRGGGPLPEGARPEQDAAYGQSAATNDQGAATYDDSEVSGREHDPSDPEAKSSRLHDARDKAGDKVTGQ